MGFKLPPLSSRIIGGEAASKCQFPYQVSLQWANPPLDKFENYCGGSLISDTWILTAGRCIMTIPSHGTFVVKAGTTSMKLKRLNSLLKRPNPSFTRITQAR